MKNCCGQYGMMYDTFDLKLIVTSLLFFQEYTSISVYFCFLLVEYYSTSTMLDESSVIGSGLEAEDLICQSCRKTHQKIPDIKYIWEFDTIELKGDKYKGSDWCYVVFMK